MPFDARHLWWPPLQRLADSLLSASLDENIADILKEYEGILKKTTAFFKGPSAESRRVLETESSLSIGTKKLPIGQALRKPVLEVSALLDLDELQTLILVRRWTTAGSESIVGEELSHDQRTSITQYYVRERAFLLTCLDQLLQSDPAEAGEHPQAACISKLLQNGLEDAVIQALLATLTDHQPSVSGSSGDQQIILASQVSTAWPKSVLKRKLAAIELGPLLDISMLLYSQSRCSCSLERGLELLSALRPLITAGSEPDALTPCWLDYQAFLLLLSVVDVGKLVNVVAKEAPLDAQAHRLGTKAAREKVDAELQSWGPPKTSSGGHPTMHGPLLLTWATFLCLSNSATSPSEEVAWQETANLAWNSGALHTICQALNGPGPAAMTHHQAAGLQQLLAAFLGSFHVSPSGLPALVLDSLLSLLATIHQGDEELCEAIWQGEAGLVPLRKFLEEARDLFPAFPAPFLRLLAALAWGPTAAAAAADYIIRMPHMTSRHEQGDPAVRELPGEDKAVVAVQDFEVCGLTVSKGLKGRLLPVPTGAVRSEAVAKSLLVCWDGALADQGGGFLLLLAFIRSSLDALRLAVEDPRRAARATSEADPAADLGLAVNLLSRLPAVYVPGALLEVRGATLPHTLAFALDMLSRTAESSLHSMGSCLEIFKGLAISMAAKVAAELSQTQLFYANVAAFEGGLDRDLVAAFPQSQLLVLREFSSRLEAPAGRYPVTLGTLEIAAKMLGAGVSHPILQAAVGYTLSHVMSRLLHGRFVAAGDRWRLVAAALQTLTAALEYEAVNEGAADISTWLRRTLGQRGAAAAYLFGALPPLPGSNDDMAGLEAALGSWFEFVPALLRDTDSSRAAVLAESFFQAQGGRAASPAAVLASYLTHPLLSPELQDGLIRVLAALGEASAPLAHVCYTACLTHCEDGDGVEPTYRQQLVAAFTHPDSVPESTFKASCELLITAIKHHPSLQGVLLYPTALAAPGAAGQEAPAAEKAKGTAKGGPKETSALDGLLSILKAATKPEGSSPAVLAMTLDVLLALWQGGPTCYGAVQLLRAQPGFWKGIAAAVPHALQQRLELGEGDISQIWQERAEAGWKLAGEARALQILALDAFRHPKAKPGGQDTSGAWAVLDAWATEGDGGRLPSLLKRYGGAPRGAALMRRLHDTAAAAAVELLATMATDASFGEHLALPGSLLGQLQMIGASIIASSGDNSVAAKELHALAHSLLAEVTGHQKAPAVIAAQGLGAALLLAAQSRRRQEHSRLLVYGQDFLYDSGKLAARIGRAFFNSQASLRALGDLLSAASIMAGFEDARLAALGALAAASGVAPAAEGSDATSAHLQALETALLPLLEQSPDLPAAGFSPRNAGLAFLEQVVKVVLSHLQRSTPPGTWADSRQALAFTRRSFRLARKWLDAAAADSELSAREDVTTGLLAVGLKALQGSPSRSTAAGKEAAELQSELRQLLPWLCKLAAVGGRRAAVSLALLTTVLTHHLQPSAWLPVLRAGLDLPALVAGAYDRLAAIHSGATSDVAADAAAVNEERQTAEEVALGTLHLILVVVQESNAGPWLASSALLDALHAVARWLLSDEIRGPTDTAAEKQWLALLSLQALLVRGARGGQWADMAAVRFAAVAHASLLDALQPPPVGEEEVPLSLLAVQEAERSACFLAGMPRLRGEWMATLPPALEQVKQACSDWLAFAAAPSLEPDLRVCCPRSSPDERVLASQRAGMAAVEGWFGLCSAGVEGQRHHADPEQLSEYTAQLAEAIYAATCHTLVYLAAIVPEGGLHEAHALEHGWPSADVLLSLQGQCIALSHDLCQQPPSGRPGRSSKLCTTLANLLVASAQLQDQLRYPQPTGHSSQVSETLERLERAKKGRV